MTKELGHLRFGPGWEAEVVDLDDGLSVHVYMDDDVLHVVLLRSVT